MLRHLQLQWPSSASTGKRSKSCSLEELLSFLMRPPEFVYLPALTLRRAPQQVQRCWSRNATNRMPRTVASVTKQFAVIQTTLSESVRTLVLRILLLFLLFSARGFVGLRCLAL